MNTILFHAARHAADRQRTRHSVARRHTIKQNAFTLDQTIHFAGEDSRREFEREIQGLPLSHNIPNPIVIIEGSSPREQEKAIHLLLAARGRAPVLLDIGPRTEREMRMHIEDAIRAGKKELCLAIAARHLASHSLAHYATAAEVSLRPLHSANHEMIPISLRFYLAVPNGFSVSAEIYRRSRFIALA